MAFEFVPHPETGRPARVEKNYVEMERQYVQELVDEAQAREDAALAELLETARAYVDQTRKGFAFSTERFGEVAVRYVEAEAASGDAKSGLTAYDAIAGDGAASGQETASSEVSTELLPSNF